ncbi:hypothetical protein Psyc_0550 [Psychrobacter arcticus 273-4]|uniref:Transmembrane protein n=1 Tax=Psychrobacter arcticus (strain DSM 17307 / VKM B-2377 / 273-4) TaxID=259536 RepID=Q4FU97_PSYA2|nr:hypothetical protein [Psychrobacter arcticus]AAZ18411.1 hypothetical protein Psyc_0550 [Psychrobacter arcticus 273-4]
MATNPSHDDSHKQTSKKSSQTTQPLKPITPIRQRLMVTWLIWLTFRLLALPLLINVFNPSRPDIVGGIAWQALWLVPAFVLTPSILRGRSPYALLIDSMFTLVYLGASGVVLFTRAYGSSWAEIAVYFIDFVLLFAINIWLFILLKRLPSMNNVVKQPR